jgi:two-component system NarL family sensor kinase
MSTKRKSAVTTSLRRTEMQARLEELEETLRAIRQGEVDGVVVSTPGGDRVFTLHGADHPYRVIIETINEGAATLTESGLILYANRRLAEMLGRPLENLIGSELRDVVQTLHGSTFNELLERAQTAPQKQECCLLVTGGRLAPTSLSLSPLSHDGFQGICMIATDLTEQRRRQEHLAKTNERLEAEIAERRRAEEALRKAQQAFESFMNHAPAVVFMKDDQGRYTFCNKKVEELLGAPAEDLVGKRHFDWVPGEAGESMHERDLTALSGKEPTEVVETIPSRNGHSFECLLVRFPFQDPSGRRLLGGVGVDVTPQKRAEAALSQLSSRLLRLQDEERRRIARDLHDSTAQLLTALALNLTLLQNEKGISENARARELLADNIKLAEEASNEVRNLSHLLHPPDLDSMGLIAAIAWHSKKLEEMTGIDLTLDLSSGLGRLPQDIEIALFRIVQESLENVRRHSGSPTAKVRLFRQKDNIVLQIKDQGRGVPRAAIADAGQSAAHFGVGLAGMRERVRQLGGRLEIETGAGGTTVTATVPIASKAGQVADLRGEIVSALKLSARSST